MSQVSCGANSLTGLTVVDDLSEALASTVCSVGFTRRSGTARVLQPSLRSLLAAHPEALPLSISSTTADPQITALVFGSVCPSKPQVLRPPPPSITLYVRNPNGVRRLRRTALCHRREESGLTDAELALCSHSCAIPSGRLQPSLNLAAAVAVVLAQCFEMRMMPHSWAQDYHVHIPASPQQSALRHYGVSALLVPWTSEAEAVYC